MLFGLVPWSGRAIVTATNSTAELAPPGLNWDYVYNYKNASAVAVDPFWILTAGHVADDAGDGSLIIDSTTYTQQEIVYHDSADLALVRYDKALPGFFPLYTGSFPTSPPPQKLSVLLVGYGHTGTVSPDSWTDGGSGNGTKRWGSQIIDRSQTVIYDAGGLVGLTTNNGVWMDFSQTDTPNEAGVGVYDSGGGTFYNENGTWKLAGINTEREGTEPDYTSTFSISMPAYETWVSGVVPEPSSSVLLVGMSVVFGWIRRFRRRSPENRD